MQPYSKKIKFIFIVFVLFLYRIDNVSAQNATNLEKIDQFLQSKLIKSNVQGFAVAIVHHDKMIFSKGYGKTADNQPVTGDTPFAIASLSKAFTAMAIMQLVEIGKLNLNSTIIYYIPAFKHNEDKITVRKLLNQTSGFSDIVYPEMKFKQQPENLESAIESMSKVKLASKADEKFHYHNPNYQVLAKIVEVASGEEFSTYLHKNIFAPLQMNQTVNLSNTKEFFSNNKLSQGHTFVFGKPLKMKEPDWFVQGSAGMISTVNDMSKWLILNINKGNFNGNKLLSSSGIEMMQTPPNETKNAYGMGWFVDEKGNLNHNGILWTYQSEQRIVREKGYGVVILFNSGLNVFQDYSAFTNGIVEILNNQNPTVSFIPTVSYEILIAIFIVFTIFFGIKRLKQVKNWQRKYSHRTKFQSWIRLIVRLLPLGFLVAIPQLFILISGRVLSWERIFWTMPSIVIWLIIVSTYNLMIIIVRLALILPRKKLRIPNTSN